MKRYLTDVDTLLHRLNQKKNVIIYRNQRVHPLVCHDKTTANTQKTTNFRERSTPTTPCQCQLKKKMSIIEFGNSVNRMELFRRYEERRFGKRFNQKEKHFRSHVPRRSPARRCNLVRIFHKSQFPIPIHRCTRTGQPSFDANALERHTLNAQLSSRVGKTIARCAINLRGIARSNSGSGSSSRRFTKSSNYFSTNLC